MAFGFGFGFAKNYVVATLSAFNPTSLFASGEQGVYFDPNNSTTLFEDAAGTIPTALERPVGRMLDLSGRGNHATQSTDIKRPTLTRRVNQFVNSETLATQSVTTRATTQTLRFEGTGIITLSGTATGVYTAGAYNVTTTAGTLTATVLGSVTRADLREANFGVGLPAYQRVGDTAINAADYDITGFPAWLRCSGGQAMATPSINFGTDKMTVFAGVRKLGDSVYPVIADTFRSGSTAFDSFGLHASQSTVLTGYAVGVGTTNTAYWSGASTNNPSPVTHILSLALNSKAISYDSAISVRINSVTQSLSDISNGPNNTLNNFGSNPLYLFSRTQSSLFFNGLAGPIIVRGAQSSAAEIANAESWINAQQKVY